jgi:hydrophobic/amphiphilic exporter-1 (mainly G- bacteria), HAE1 family
VNRLVSFFIERWVFALSIFLAVVFFGLSAGTRLGVDLLPEFEFPIVAVNVSYPGAGSAETARQLAEPIEDAVATIAGVTDVSSFSGEGFSFVIVQFAFGTSVDQAAIDVKQAVDAIAPTLPDDASLPVIQKFDPNDQPILNLALVAPGEDLLSVRDVARERLEVRLQQVQGVAAITTLAPVSREVQVLLDPGRLEALGLSPTQVAGAIRAASATVPAGTIQVGGERILLSVRSAPQTADEVADLFVDPTRGLLVSDVATVRDALAEAERFVRLNGESAVLLEVRKTSGANSVATARGVRAALAGITLPPGYEVRVIADSSVFIENSVFDTIRETGLAVLAVAFIVLLFVGRLGSTFSVVLAIPITMTGAIMLFGVLGFTFNVVTLLAITVAVGLVVDDSIVIAENIDRYRALGLGMKEAVLQGAGEVAVPVLTATLSLLAVFVPIAFLPGVIGQFFSQFGLSLAATIAVSYLEAMFFLTVRMAYLPNPLPPRWRELPTALRAARADLGWTARLPRRVGFWALVVLGAVAVLAAARLGLWGSAFAGWREAGLLAGASLAALAIGLAPLLGLLRYALRALYHLVGPVFRTLHEVTDGAVRNLREGYANALGFVLDRATATLVAAALLVASLGVIFPLISFNFVSPVDAGQVAVRVELPPGTPLERTDTLAALAEGAVRDHPAVRDMITTVGSGGAFGNPNALRATVRLELRRGGGLPGSFAVADELRPRVEAALAAYPEARVTVTSDDGGAVPVDTGLALTLVGGDRALLEERDRLARDVMSANPWLRDVRSSLEGSVAERVFAVSNAALAGTGLTTSEVASTLRAYNVGVRAGDLREAGEETPIIVRVNPASIADEQTLLSLPIFAPALRSYLPLGVLGRFELQPAPVSVNRANQAYVATVSADVAEGSPGQFQLRSQVEAAFAEAGVTDEFVRVTAGIGPDLLGDLVFYGPIAFALALLLNYLVIASQFNSLRYPLYLLLTVPLALVGALWLFFLTGSPLDVISVLGVVILIGLVTKNAILLLDVVVGQLQAGETLRDALVRAGRLRLRPILMTALTVVVISIPLLVGLGEGNEFRRPLGLVILGGVVSSTFLTLFVVPAAFYRFERRRYELRGTGAQRAGEGVEAATDASAATDAPAAPPPPPLPPRAPTVEPHRHGLERPAAPATATSD